MLFQYPILQIGIFSLFCQILLAVNLPRETKLRGRCVGQCLRLHGTVPSTGSAVLHVNSTGSDIYRSLECSTDACAACLQPCHTSFVSFTFCQKSCQAFPFNGRALASVCLASCSSLYATESTSSESSATFNITNFRVVCEDPFTSSNRRSLTIFLGWLLTKMDSSHHVNYQGISFVLVITVNETQRISSPAIGDLFHVSGLEPNTKYDLQLIGLLHTGDLMKSNILIHNTGLTYNSELISPSSIYLLPLVPQIGKTLSIEIEWTGNSCWNIVELLPYNGTLRQNNVPSFFTGPNVRKVRFVQLVYEMSYQVKITPSNANMNMTGRSLLRQFSIESCRDFNHNTSLKEGLCTPPKLPTTFERNISDSFWQKTLTGRQQHGELLALPSIVIPSVQPTRHRSPTADSPANTSQQDVSLLVWLLPLLLGSFIAFGSIGFVVCKLRRANQSAKSIVYLTKNPAYIPTVVVPRSLQPADPAADPLEVAPTDFIIEQDLGEGEFGMVFGARIQSRSGLAARLPGKSHVAVKLLKADSGGVEETQFLREISVMKKVTSHPNVLGLLGYCTRHASSGFPVCLLTELCPLGDLKRHLDGLLLGQGRGSGRGREGTTQGQLLCWGIQISAGMSHLAACGMVHRDLAARNVLIGEGFQMKISDFGLCRDVCNAPDSEYRLVTGGRLPYRWLAPECFSHQTFSSSSDVWAFGVLLWEIFTLGATPYGTQSLDRVVQLLAAGTRLAPPPDCPAPVAQLMAACWQREPGLRPSFASLVTSLQRLTVVQRDYLEVAAEGEDWCGSSGGGGSSVSSSSTGGPVVRLY